MKNIANNLKAISSDRRLTIIQFLHEKPRNLQEIAFFLKVTSPTASFHLRKLLQESFVVSERRGKETYFIVTPQLRLSKFYKHVLQG